MANENQQFNLTELAPGAFQNIQNQIRQKSDAFARVYANSIAIQWSPWDVSLILGQIVGRQDDQKPIIEETLQVILTREVAKALVALLSVHIGNYEAQLGEIKLPNVVQPEASPAAIESAVPDAPEAAKD